MIVFYAVQASLLGAALVIFVARVRAMRRVACRAADAAFATVDEAHADLAHAASSGTYALRGIGRLAPPLALAGAIVVMGRGFGAPSGLAARAAVVQAGVAFGIGVATTVVCFAAAAGLLRRARGVRADLERGARALDRSGADV